MFSFLNVVANASPAAALKVESSEIAPFALNVITNASPAATLTNVISSATAASLANASDDILGHDSQPRFPSAASSSHANASKDENDSQSIAPSAVPSSSQPTVTSVGSHTPSHPIASPPARPAHDKRIQVGSSSAPSSSSVPKDSDHTANIQEAVDAVDIENVDVGLSELIKYISELLAFFKVTAGDTPYTSAKTFEELNLSPELLRGLYSEMGFEKPSKIQAISLPMILTPPYQNLIAQAHNGSGKTTCFVLGMLSRVDPKIAAPQALCVCPTRELAMQNQEVLVKMGKHTGITSVCAVPTDAGNYVSTSRRGPVNDQVVIGTPGTLKKWMSTKVLSTRHIKILVFDEADHMLAQDGFQDDSLRIIRDIQKNRDDCQILLFSATYDENVKQFTTRVISKANQVFVKKEDLSLDVIKQYLVKCPDELAKVEVLKDRIFPLAEKLGQSIIFVRTRENASMLHSKLEAEGYKCTSIQGGLKLEDRDRVIKEFRTGLTKILISTDVLARGFDQAQVTLVVNFDLPVKHGSPDPDYEVYLHRIGRSGRFGRKGAAFNFICNDRDERIMSKIERYFERQVPEVPWDSEDAFEAVLKDAGLA